MRLMCLRGQAALGFWSRDQALGFRVSGLESFCLDFFMGS